VRPGGPPLPPPGAPPAAPRRARPFPLPGAGRSLALLGALLGAAAILDLGALHRLEHGDSIVPVLVSLQRWTPFYWDQERYGMLAPLLALPVRDPLGNLLLQRGLLVLAGLSAVVLLARHTLGDRDWPLGGALAAALLLPLAPEAWRFEYLGDQPYGLSLALALLGLALAEPPPPDAAAGAGPGATRARRRPGRVAAGLLLVLLAHWVNAATGVLLGALALARGAEDLLEGVDRAAVADRLRVDAALLAAGLVLGQALLLAWPRWSGHPLRLPLGFLPLADWPGAWRAIAAGALSDQGRWLAWLLAAAVAGAAALSLPALRHARRGALVRAATLVAAAVAYAAFAGALRWVADNHFHWRYLAPSALLVHLAALSLAAEPLARTLALARPALTAALVALPVVALAVGGPPSLASVRSDLDRVAGRWTEDVLGAGCDLVAGDYWTTWPAIWHVALVAHERGQDRPVYGVAHRANPTVPAWWGRPREGLRICRPHGEAPAREAERWLRVYGLWPVEVLERRETVDVLAVQPAPPGP
jgi:hypothetical protein